MKDAKFFNSGFQGSSAAQVASLQEGLGKRTNSRILAG